MEFALIGRERKFLPNKMYGRGRRYEYKISKKLRAEGWTVLRTAGSHGLFDLIAIKPPEVHEYMINTDRLKATFTTKGSIAGNYIKLIQCKSGKSSKRAIKNVLDSDIKRFEGLYSVSVEVV